MKPPPPMLPASMNVTAIENPTAPAASTALPPARSTFSATCAPYLSGIATAAVRSTVSAAAAGAWSAGSSAGLQPASQNEAARRAVINHRRVLIIGKVYYRKLTALRGRYRRLAEYPPAFVEVIFAALELGTPFAGAV